MPGYGQGGYGWAGYGGGPRPSGQVPSVDYYMSLLSSQYQNAPNQKAWLQTLLIPFHDAAALLSQWSYEFDIDEAIGSQLDIIGQIVGASRVLAFQPAGGVSPILNDSTYRILLKAKVAQNQWDGLIASVYPIWQTLFPGGTIIIQDNQNMTAVISLAGNFTSIIQDMILNDLIVPRPDGVMYTYVFAKLPMFGYDVDTAYIAGYDAGFYV